MIGLRRLGAIRKRSGKQQEEVAPAAPRFLLTQSEIRFGVARDRHRLGLVLGAFMPSSNRVTAVRNVLNLVLARLVAGGVVGRGHDDDVCRHLRVNVAEKWGCSRTIKL